jgi:hypothetical protein
MGEYLSGDRPKPHKDVTRSNKAIRILKAEK